MNSEVNVSIENSGSVRAVMYILLEQLMQKYIRRNQKTGQSNLRTAVFQLDDVQEEIKWTVKSDYKHFKAE
jgi:hypothetical protein